MSYSALSQGQKDNPPQYNSLYPTAPDPDCVTSNAFGFKPPQTGPITNQPGMGQESPGNGTGVWKNVSQDASSCPPGLQYLIGANKLLVQQRRDSIALTRCESKRKYTIKDMASQELYHAVETSGCDNFGTFAFDTQITDNSEDEVIRLRRLIGCHNCCMYQSIQVSCPPGTLVGTVEEEFKICNRSFAVKDGNEELVFRIEVSSVGMCESSEFKIMTPDGTAQIGCIEKIWVGFIREMMERDKFHITFPMNLDVRMKAVLIGAALLIDILLFEQN